MVITKCIMHIIPLHWRLNNKDDENNFSIVDLSITDLSTLLSLLRPHVYLTKKRKVTDIITISDAKVNVVFGVFSLEVVGCGRISRQRMSMRL